MDLKKQIIPFYLTIIILLQIELTAQKIIISCLPLLLIIISIHIRNKKIGMIGIFLFYLVSLPQIILPGMENLLHVLAEIILVLLPSLLLLNTVLQLENTETYHMQYLYLEQKKAWITTLILLITIATMFYLLTTIPLQGFLLSTDSVEGQVFLLAAITTACCTPFLLPRG